MSFSEEEKISGVALVVDDDATVRILIREVLERVGLTVYEAGDGSDALRFFEECKPDIVLLDVILPGTDGFTVCREIRRLPAGRHTPVLMMTGMEDVTSIQRAYEEGATDFIAKPFNWIILSYRVRYLLRGGRLFQALGESQQRLSYAQAMARMGSWEWDLKEDRLLWSDAAYRLFQVDPIGFDGTYHAFLNSVHPHDRELVDAAIAEVVHGGKPYSVDHQIRLPDGTVRFVHTEAELVVDKDGEPVRVSGTVQDITERKESEEKIRTLAFFDSLTGLPNRMLFKENLERTVAHAERKGRKVAILFLDLDRFKAINDTMGHSVGDLLLQEFSARLRNCIRKGDTAVRADLNQPDCPIARLGGDEFTVILDDIADPHEAALVAQRLIELAATPFVQEGTELFLSASIGISIYPDDGADFVALIKNADTAMYNAKAAGKNTFRFYCRSMHEKAFEQLKVESLLHHALERRELSLLYQPQFDLLLGSVTGLETLVRWENPELGLVPPSVFIPLAQESGLILAMDQWMLETACRQLRLWENDGLDLRVAVNLSGRKFRQKGFPSELERLIRDCGINPSRLELELTEEVLMQECQETRAVLNALKAIGVSLVMDRFGTGFSSLNYLKGFKLDALKIDRSFVQELTTDQETAAIVSAIIAMAKSLKLRVVAEGVETVEQFGFLRKQGCRLMQGYLFSHPLTGESVGRALNEVARDPRPAEPEPSHAG